MTTTIKMIMVIITMQTDRQTDRQREREKENALHFHQGTHKLPWPRCAQ